MEGVKKRPFSTGPGSSWANYPTASSIEIRPLAYLIYGSNTKLWK